MKKLIIVILSTLTLIGNTKAESNCLKMLNGIENNY